MNCSAKWLDFVKRRVKRALANQGYLDKYYPHSTLTFYLQVSVAYDFEIDKFARIWCDSDLKPEIIALKEIFETENKDDATWRTEILTNKYVAENIDRLIYLVSTVER
jgi:hypothetical protein